MVKIRLSKTGTKHKASYRIVVSEARTKRDGQTLEIIGYWDPKLKPPMVKINQQRLDYWQRQGAQLTTAVRNLIENEKIT